MPVLGLVFVLEDDGDATRSAAAGLEAAPDVELGERSGHRWPAVLDAPTTQDVERRVDALRAVPGVAAIDVVYADFEDLLAPDAASAGSQLREER